MYFIETKKAGSGTEGASIQLGVWIAAWHQRIRYIMAAAGKESRVITIPAIQAVGSAWKVLFVVDTGNEIHVMDEELVIGHSSNLLSLYQLQAALRVIAAWMENSFRPWITTLLQNAMRPREPTNVH